MASLSGNMPGERSISSQKSQKKYIQMNTSMHTCLQVHPLTFIALPSLTLHVKLNSPQLCHVPTHLWSIYLVINISSQNFKICISCERFVQIMTLMTFNLFRLLLPRIQDLHIIWRICVDHDILSFRLLLSQDSNHEGNLNYLLLTCRRPLLGLAGCTIQSSGRHIRRSHSSRQKSNSRTYMRSRN